MRAHDRVLRLAVGDAGVARRAGRVPEELGVAHVVGAPHPPGIRASGGAGRRRCAPAARRARAARAARRPASRRGCRTPRSRRPRRAIRRDAQVFEGLAAHRAEQVAMQFGLRQSPEKTRQLRQGLGRRDARDDVVFGPRGDRCLGRRFGRSAGQVRRGDGRRPLTPPVAAGQVRRGDGRRPLTPPVAGVMPDGHCDSRMDHGSRLPLARQDFPWLDKTSLGRKDFRAIDYGDHIARGAADRAGELPAGPARELPTAPRDPPHHVWNARTAAYTCAHFAPGREHR